MVNLTAQALLAWLALFLTFKQASPANILFVYAIATYSHRTAVEPLAHKLVERGHNVTFLSPVKALKENSKFNEFSPIAVEAQYQKLLTGLGDIGFPDRIADKYTNFMTKTATIADFPIAGCTALLNSPDFKPWVEQNKFDLFILAHPFNKCAYPIAYKTNASVIVMSASTFVIAEEDMFGFPVENSWLRRFHISNFFSEMSFYDRFYNALNPLYLHFYYRFFVYPKLDAIIQSSFPGENIPPLEELERLQTDLIFINQHFSEDFARSLPPMIVPVGGMHCTGDHKNLPEVLEDFINGAGDSGFIFISFGSMVKMSKVPDKMIQLFFNAIKNMKTRFLWRWDSTPPINLPKNVLTSKWFPQQDLLAHPKIKGFISHGGLMSIQQAIFHAVPLIVLPVVYDQPFNAFRVNHHKIGIHLELSELTEENFRDAVDKIVHDKSIKEKMNLVSRRFRDRPISPVDTAVYWTEYVLRYKDTSHLKPLGIHQTWWERRLLDIWAVILISFIVAVYAIIKGCIILSRILFYLVDVGKPQKKIKLN